MVTKDLVGINWVGQTDGRLYENCMEGTIQYGIAITQE
jgi:hypothetical protein